MQPERLLHTLVLVEIILTVTLVTIGILGEPFLPTALQSYLQTRSDTPWSVRDWILLPIDLCIFALAVVAWVGLFRGWRCARRLYTGLWVASLPLLLFYGPVVASAVSRFLDTLAVLVGGLILGILYFSELRHCYAQPNVG